MVETFASRLRQLRDQAGWSQAELARRAGLHREGVGQLERGVREPAWATVQALARALEIEVTAFVIEPGKRPRGKKRSAG
jgi:transcriptional regulator with XRE-family HTH domain